MADRRQGARHLALFPPAATDTSGGALGFRTGSGDEFYYTFSQKQAKIYIFAVFGRNYIISLGETTPSVGPARTRE
jgi:hypothetical protein